jgi:hypothetical protein
VDAVLKSRIVAAFNALPDGCRYPRATAADLTAFESEFGPIPDDYRWFLSECSGGTVGSEWVDGIAELPETHRKFRAESDFENGWSMRGVFIIGWDGAGNPFGIESSTGKLLVEDHNFGGVHEIAASFAAFLERGLLA